MKRPSPFEPSPRPRPSWLPMVFLAVAAGAAGGWFVSALRPPPVSVPVANDVTGRLHSLQRQIDGLQRTVTTGLTGVTETQPDAAAVAALQDRLTELERDLAARPTDAAGDVAADAGAGAGPPVGPLVAALAAGDRDTVARLLVSGVDVDARDDDRQTPLAAAAVSGDTRLVELLLAHGARLERTAQRGLTPLLAALDAQQQDTALLLLDRGANPKAVDKNGEDALIWAAFNGCDRVVERLLRSGDGLDLNRAAHDGRTALHDAARRGRLAVARQLLDAGADPNVADREGATPLQLAVRAGHGDVATLLRQRGGR